MTAASDPTAAQIDIAIVGGSGFGKFDDQGVEHRVDTPYGETSDVITVHDFGHDFGGIRVGFLPRHGRDHTIPPHKINSRANIWALQSLGARRIVAVSACGSLQSRIVPGSIVICDQFVDRTGRADTFFDGPDVAHVSAADPYCPQLRGLASLACRQAGMAVHDHGTVVVINGPRYSSRAESRWYASAGWEIIGMTQYPELILARELGICYVTVALVTDYDAGIPDNPDVGAVSHAEVLRVFNQNVEQVRHALFAMLKTVPGERECECATSGAKPFK